MKPRKWKRAYTIHQAIGEPLTFSVRWRLAHNPYLYGQRIYQAPSIEEALRMAPAVAGLSTPAPSLPTIPLEDAFAGALAASRRGPTARADWAVAVRSFARWLVDVHPRVGTWNQLSRAIVADYADSLRADLSPNGQRMRVQPLQQTDTHMAERHGFPRLTEGLRVSRALAKPTAIVHLADVLALVAALPSRLAVGAALQGLAGLRVQEAFRLTWDRVDLRRGLVEISGAVKTDWSARVIPICSTVANLLRSAPRAAARPIGAEQVLLGYQTWGGYSQTLTAAIREWNPAITWASKDLRNCLPTFAEMRGLRNGLWEQYLGHAPKDVSARHYIPRLATVSAGDEHEKAGQMDLFRDQVVTPLEAAIEAVRAANFSPSSTHALPTA